MESWQPVLSKGVRAKPNRGAGLVNPGDRYGRLEVIEQTGRDPRGKVIYLCRCDCGATTPINSGDLRSGATRSCGCLNREAARARATTHGHSRARNGLPSRTYKTWMAMRQRCSNPDHHKFHRYGGNGVTVCARWQASFENFLADMGERPDGMTIDRIDPAGNYEPDNCRWADIYVQNRNRRT